jgi:hypothetical protein
MSYPERACMSYKEYSVKNTQKKNTDSTGAYPGGSNAGTGAGRSAPVALAPHCRGAGPQDGDAALRSE